jgi:hypothetical protein
MKSNYCASFRFAPLGNRIRMDIMRAGSTGAGASGDADYMKMFQENYMKKIVIVALATCFAANLAFAADNGCAAMAAEKKLHGAAKNSFIKKCEKDAAVPASPCAAKAAGKKLHGAAKNSFIKKCEKDAAAAK